MLVRLVFFVAVDAFEIEGYLRGFCPRTPFEALKAVCLASVIRARQRFPQVRTMVGRTHCNI